MYENDNGNLVFLDLSKLSLDTDTFGVPSQFIMESIALELET